MNSCSAFVAARGLLASLMVVLTLVGCSSWKPVRTPLEAGLSGPDAPKSVRVRLVDGTAFDLREASATADSLRGQRVLGESYEGREVKFQTTPYAVALTEVRSIEKYGHDGKKTALVLVVSALVVVAALAIAVGTGMPSTSP